MKYGSVRLQYGSPSVDYGSVFLPKNETQKFGKERKKIFTLCISFPILY